MLPRRARGAALFGALALLPLVLPAQAMTIEPSSQITTPADTSQPSSILFKLTGLASGSYVVRLRVDGVDSIPVVHSGTPPVAGFDPAQKVSVP